MGYMRQRLIALVTYPRKPWLLYIHHSYKYTDVKITGGEALPQQRREESETRIQSGVARAAAPAKTRAHTKRTKTIYYYIRGPNHAYGVCTSAVLSPFNQG